MYSYEDRVRAVDLYLKLGKRIKATIRQSGSRLCETLAATFSDRPQLSFVP